MTNNPQKIAALRSCGVEVARIPIASVRTSHNGQYLHAKRTKLGHLAPRQDLIGVAPVSDDSA